MSAIPCSRHVGGKGDLRNGTGAMQSAPGAEPIQKDKPADTSNWLPTPAGNFNLTMRLYGPQTSVLDGSYRLPAVKRAE